MKVLLYLGNWATQILRLRNQHRNNDTQVVFGSDLGKVGFRKSLVFRIVWHNSRV